MRAIIETSFDVVYLISVITIGIIMIRNCNGNKEYRLFGIMAVVLGAGDSFHLVPRALAASLLLAGILFGRNYFNYHSMH